MSFRNRFSAVMRCVSPRSMRVHSARDQPRQQVVGKDAFGALVAAVDREGDALVQERQVAECLRRRSSSAGSEEKV